MNIVLAGLPNAGKTTLFNRLTKSNRTTGNFHGVTTSAYQKKVGDLTFFDVPGAYSFDTLSMEEGDAVKTIKKGDVIVNVIDSLTLENGLNFTKKLIEQKGKVVVYLTKTKQLTRRGGWIKRENLELLLGVPVFCGSYKVLLSKLKSGIDFEIKSQEMPLNRAYYGGNLRPKPVERLLYSGVTCVLIFVALVLSAFFLAFYPNMLGSFLKDATYDLITVKLCSFCTANLQSEQVRLLVSEGIFGGVGGVLSFIPQLGVLYLFLIILDESGVTSALSFGTDGLFKKVNLSGRAAFSLVTGFGCTAAAIATTKGSFSKSAQRRTVAVLPFIPCGAKLPVFLTVLSPLFKNPFPVISILYFSGILFSLALSKILGKGRSETMLYEVTPISLPDFKRVIIKLCFQLKSFIIKVSGVVFLFCVISFVLSHYSFKFEFVEVEESMLSHISKLILPIFLPLGINDWRLAYAAICGLIAKENVAAAITLLYPSGLSLSLATSLGFSVFMLLCPACITAFIASVHEVGFKFSAKCFLLQLVLALVFGGIVRLIVGLC